MRSRAGFGGMGGGGFGGRMTPMLKWTLIVLFVLYVVQLVAGSWIKLPDRDKGPELPTVAAESSWDDAVVIQQCTASFEGTLPTDAEKALASVVVLENDLGQGSGVLVSPDGVILTAAHVVEGTGRISARTYDGAEFVARKVRVDVSHDVAILQLQDAPRTSCSQIAPGDGKVGQSAFVLGAPEGLDWSISSGIVSAVRSENGIRVLQTDASVNPGNSGGPVMNAQGQVLGVVSYKYMFADGLGFAIPTSDTLTYLNAGFGAATLLPERGEEKGRTFSVMDENLAGQTIPVSRWFFWNSMDTGQFKPWQPLTSLLMNGAPLGTAIQWLVLFFFWGTVEGGMGRKRFLWGLLAALGGSSLIVLGLDLIGAIQFSVAVGLNPLITALIVYFGMMNPKATIRLFFILPVKAMWIVWGTGLLEFLWFLAQRDLGSAVALFAWVSAFAFMWIGDGRIQQFVLRQKAKRKAKEYEKFTVLPGGRDDDYIH